MACPLPGPAAPLPDPWVPDGTLRDPAADVPGDQSCRAARRPGGVLPCDVPPRLVPDGAPLRPAARADRPGTGVAPPTTGFWPDDRGAGST